MIYELVGMNVHIVATNGIGCYVTSYAFTKHEGKLRYLKSTAK